MSSAKVSSSAPVGHSTSMVKLGSVRSSPVVAASVVSINTSNNTGTATEQYLQDESSNYEEQKPQSFEESSLAKPSIPLELLNTEEPLPVSFQSYSSLLSAQEAEEHVETYERTMEAIDDTPKKKTQGFG